MTDQPPEHHHDDETREISAGPVNAATIRMTTVGAADRGSVEIDVPRELGPVQLIRELGRGGMGVVYLGHHRFLDRDVAVKFLLNAVAGPEDPAFTRFMEETSAAARIEHPALVSILHADVVETMPYLVMQYVDGAALSDLLERHGPLPVPAAVAALHEISGAIGALHNAGILHRDIKPSNVLAASDGRLFVSDFGLAIERSVTALGPTPTRVAGTPAYMAPETFEGEVSPRSDVYALGILGFELLTATVPFTGSLLEIRPLHEHEPLPLERLREVDAPEALIELLERASYKNMLFRHKSAEHFRRALVGSIATEEMLKEGAAQLERLVAGARSSAGSEPDDSADGAASTSSYFERLSQMADERLRSASVRVDEPVPSTERTAPTAPAATPIGRPELRLDRCPSCNHDLTKLPRRYRCPDCSFLYDEAMFVLEGVWPPPDEARSRGASIVALVMAIVCTIITGGLLIAAMLAGGAIWWGAFAIVGLLTVAIGLFCVGSRSARRANVRLLVTRTGVARCTGGFIEAVPWREFYDWGLLHRGDGRWELRFERDAPRGLWYMVTQNPLHDGSTYALAFEADARTAATVRRELRDRVRSAAGF